MENLKGLLRVLEEKSADSTATLDAEYRRLGESLLDADREAVAATELKELFEKALATNERLSGNLNQQERLTKLVSQLEELDERLRAKKEEMKTATREMEPRFAEIGHLAFEGSAGDADGIEPFRKEVGQLRAIETEIRDHNRELSKTGASRENDGILGQALLSGKRLYLQGLIRTKNMRAEALYRQLGKDICESEAITELDSSAYVDVLEFLLKFKDEQAKLDTQTTALTNKRDRIEKEIETLAGGERARRFGSRLESEQKKTQGELSLLLRELGVKYSEGNYEKAITGRKVKGHLDAIRDMSKEIAVLESKRERIQAALRIEAIDREVAGKRSKIRSLEETIRKCNDEMDVLSAKITALDEERSRLVEVRGSEEIGE
ncbi:MAG TPA: hypothetical protein VMV68_00980 [Spirochaetia bacterium]|nr:hypothetical protein [Spirochaetia bacterium]